MSKKTYDPETPHLRTGARRTTTSETASPSRIKPPTPAQVQAEQQRLTEYFDNRAGNVVKTEPQQLPLPLPLPSKMAPRNVR
jgi:hypothetical protein